MDDVISYINSVDQTKKNKEIYANNNLNFNIVNIKDIIEDVESNYNTVTLPKKSINKLYTKMKRFLLSKINICLYGIGKKEQLIEDFILKNFEDFIIVYANTNLQSVKLTNIFARIIQDLLSIPAINNENIISLKMLSKHINSLPNLWQALNKILKKLKSINENVVIYISDIAGHHLKDEKCHYYLSKLFKKSNVFGITTVENTYFTLLLTREIINNYNFVYLKYDSYIPYNLNNISTKEEIFMSKNKKTYESFFIVIDNLTEIQKYDN